MELSCGDLHGTGHIFTLVLSTFCGLTVVGSGPYVLLRRPSGALVWVSSLWRVDEHGRSIRIRTGQPCSTVGCFRGGPAALGREKVGESICNVSGSLDPANLSDISAIEDIKGSPQIEDQVALCGGGRYDDDTKPKKELSVNESRVNSSKRPAFRAPRRSRAPNTASANAS